MQRGAGPIGRMMGGGRPLPTGAGRRVDRRTVRRVLGFFRPYRRRVALTLVAILIVAILGLLNPFLLKLIIDEAIPERDLDALSLYVGLRRDLVVDRGRIVERESHAALLAAGGRYARLHREQFATEEQGGLAGSDLGDSGSAMPLLSRSAIG